MNTEENTKWGNLELLLNAIPSPEGRTYLSTAIVTLLSLGFTHSSAAGWVSPLEREPHGQPLRFDAAVMLLHAAALELSRAGKPVGSAVIMDAVNVIAPLRAHDLDAVKIARESALSSRSEHDYLPQTREQAETWQPHGWVLDAIQAASLGVQPPAGPELPGIGLAGPELAGFGTFRDGKFGSWLFQTHAMAASFDSTALDAGPANSEIVPLFRASTIDMQRAHQLAEEIGVGNVSGCYVLDRDELEHFLVLLLGRSAVKS